MITETDEYDEYQDYGEEDETWAALAEEAEVTEAMAEDEYYDEDNCELEAEIADDIELQTALEEMGENNSNAGEALAPLQESKKEGRRSRKSSRLLPRHHRRLLQARKAKR